jgi:SagB-type dehydrogenase family enzyme
VTATPIPFLRSTLYGDEHDLWDPAETFHEASRLHPALGERQAAGIVRLAASATLQQLSARQARRNPHLPSVELQPEPLPTATLRDAIERRRSQPPRPGHSLPLGTLATLLHAAYGVTPDGRRAVPSGGALYPLELFVAAPEVAGLESGLWRLDPHQKRLEQLPGDGGELADAVPLPELVEHARAVVFLAATFWRTRFKYGLRGYRFALLEAGHAAQNLLLAAAVLGVTTLPLGGFYDARVDELLGLDGVDQSVLYAVILGGAAQ